MASSSPSEPPAAGPTDPVALWARRLGSYAWMEMTLFEVLGRWSVELDDDRAAIMAATHSAHHGWRAELWQRHLPLLGPEPPESFIVPASPTHERLADALDADPALGSDRTLARLAGVHRVVVPAMSSAYRAHRRDASPVDEGPTLRTLRIVIDDLDHDAEEAASHLLRLGSSEFDVTSVSAHERRVADVIGSVLPSADDGGSGRTSAV